MKQIYHRAKRIDNGELVEGFPFCVVINNVNRLFLIPIGIELPKDKTIGEVQVEIEGSSLERLKSVKNGIKEFEKL
jgi:hypothetical protein